MPTLQVRAVPAGSSVATSIVPRYSGSLRVSLVAGKRRLSRCSVAARAKRSYVCRLRTRGTAASKLRVMVTLRRTNGKLVRRTVKLSARKARSAARDGHRNHSHR